MLNPGGIVAIGRHLGGKVTLTKKLLPFLPEATTYVEPCMGFFTLGLNYAHPCHKVAYDLHPRTVNLLWVIQSQVWDLVSAINDSPRDGQALERCWESCVDVDPLEDARRWYWVSAGTYSGAGSRWNTSFTPARIERCQHHTANHLHVVSRRLRGVSILQGDGLRFAHRHASPDTLFYFDPTYENSVRGAKDNRAKNPEKSLTRNQYAYETDQSALLETVLNLKGMVVVSGYPNGRYDDALEGWVTKDFDSYDSAQNKRTERIWINRAAWSRLRWKEFAHAQQMEFLVS